MKREDLTDKTRIVEALAALASGSLSAGAIPLLNCLGYESEKTFEQDTNTSNALLEVAGQKDFANPGKAHIEEWRSVEFLFQFTDEEVRNSGQNAFDFDSSSADLKSDRLIESYLFFAVELKGESYSRTVLADITREINRLFPMPALIIFRHGQTITLSVIDRRLHKRDQSRDVLLKVTLIKDILFSDPIRAHIDILHDLSLRVLQDEFHFHNFVGLHLALKKRLDTEALNRKFYSDLANWYFWALGHEALVPPRDVKTDDERSIFLIRLLTRLIFCWFLQEKGLIPRDLFRRRFAEQMVKDASPSAGSYYCAFLQNLFFATLNQEPDKRGFRKKYAGTRDGNRGATSLYRYADLLNDADAFEKVLHDVPFVNGGLFDCLDEVYDEADRPNVRLDDFSDEKKNTINVPNELFFGEDREVDLTNAYGDARHRREHARGLLDVLSRYKFTVEESTPLEQEVALDPELLGRVFENLLASYNEDTRSTARKATGSFYTPRGIVSYMVDEALVSYFNVALSESKQDKPDIEARLRLLFVAESTVNNAQFSHQETVSLIAAIDRVKILDPACGSGAFLMGSLHRLVDLLQKLDPKNEHWRTLQRRRAVEETDLAFRHGDKEQRTQRLDDINEVFERNTSDYGRKLYLIENCIYGVDIQPIACQIAKLRFFISLIVDQNVNRKAINFGVRPLPNLEAKVVAADTLVPLERPKAHQFDLLHAQVSPLRRELSDVRHRYFLARSPVTKAKCRERDGELRREIAVLLRESGWSSEAALQMAEWNPYDQNTHATFFDPEWMFGLTIGKVRLDENSGAPFRGNFAVVNELGGQINVSQSRTEVESGLDIVIGNPPYIRLQTLKQKDPQLVEFLRDHFESARKGNYDIYVVFVERGLQFLKPMGNLAYILPHKFFNAQYGEPIRLLTSRAKYLRHIVHFGDQQVFPGATNYVCLLFLLKSGSDSLSFVKVDNLENWLERRVGTEAIFPAEDITASEWNFAVGTDAKVFNKLSGVPKRLGDIADRMSQGIRTSANEVYVLEMTGERGKVVTAYSKQLDREVTLERDSVSLFLQGREIKPFKISHTDRIVIIPYKFEDGRAELLSVREYQSKYPLTLEYLRENKRFLEDRENGRMRGSEWYAYIYPKSIDLMLLPKILVPDIADRASFALDSSGKYAFTSGYGITIKSNRVETLTFVLGLLNSRVSDYYWRHVSTPLRGGFYRNFTQFIQQLPIPSASAKQQALVGTVVDYLLFLNNTSDGDYSSMFGYFEQINNGLVYELFFPDELHLAKLRPFDLLEKGRLPQLSDLAEEGRLGILRESFERLYDSKHPLRGCLHDLGSLETVRIIEGRE